MSSEQQPKEGLPQHLNWANADETMPPPKSLPSGRRSRVMELGGVRAKQGFIPRQWLEVISEEAPDLVVLTVHYQGYPAGTVFVPNRQLEKNEGLSHMAYPDGLYSAFRGMLYALDQLGVTHPDGEQKMVHEDAECLLAASNFLKRRVMTEVQMRAMFALVANRLARATNPEKKKARKNLQRGIKENDARGRVNPSAASMARGAAAHQLRKRVQGILKIGKVYKRYARILANKIDEEKQELLFKAGAHRTVGDSMWRAAFRHQLELDLILRLGITLRRLERKKQETYARETDGLFLSPQYITFTLADDPEGFYGVKEAMGELINSVIACTETERPSVTISFTRIRLEAARMHASQNNWLMAKDLLKEAAALLR